MRTTSVGPGDRIADRRLVDLLGSGGEGEVWEAVRPDGSRCALKLVRPEVLPAPDEVRRRGQWLVRIDHPSLVTVSRGGRFTGGALAGWGFVEMDLVDGPSMQDVGPVPDAADRLRGVAEALDALHAGVWSDGVPLIHRDVKPGNLLAAGGGLVLVDPSTMRGLDTRDLTQVGTPAYVAPEVASGRFGPLVDVYGLGATVAALATGARGGALRPVLAEPWAYGLPEGVCAAVDPDPARRPRTCQAVVDEAGPIEIRLEQAGVLDDEGGPVAPGPAWAPAVLSVVALVPSLAWAVRQSRPSLVPASWVVGAVVAAAVVHLGTHLLTRRFGAGLLAPPWAWGDLIADRSWDADRRTAWLSDVVAGTILLAAAGVALVVLGDAPAALAPGVVVVGVGLVLLLRRLAAVSRRAAWAPVWTLTLPLRILGGLPRLLVTGGSR